MPSLRRSGETGRRARLKIWFGKPSVGSIPTSGTIRQSEGVPSHPRNPHRVRLCGFFVSTGIHSETVQAARFDGIPGGIDQGMVKPIPSNAATASAGRSGRSGGLGIGTGSNEQGGVGHADKNNRNDKNTVEQWNSGTLIDIDR